MIDRTYPISGCPWIIAVFYIPLGSGFCFLPCRAETVLTWRPVLGNIPQHHRVLYRAVTLRPATIRIEGVVNPLHILPYPSRKYESAGAHSITSIRSHLSLTHCGRQSYMSWILRENGKGRNSIIQCPISCSRQLMNLSRPSPDIIHISFGYFQCRGGM